MIEDITLRVKPEIAASEKRLTEEICKIKGIKFSSINDTRIVKRSIDARQRQIFVNLTVRVATHNDKKINNCYEPIMYHSVTNSVHQLIIVGAGPAGLFAALKAIELGIKPIIIERGVDVDSRRKDLAQIARTNKVNPESNYCFGEGGAGAYSDGKLFTRSKKRGSVEHILHILHQHGAKDDILVDAHPHIGSDKLPLIIKSIRETIINCGGDVYFNTKMTELIIEDSQVKGVKTDDGKIFNGNVILATGHSARDVYKYLHENKIKLEAKGLAIGVRLEHPQHLIDCLQYHNKEGRGKYLPAAEYNFVSQVDDRGVYSFCMCPGGIIVPAASDDEQSVVNGMSPSNRGSKWSNSGMVVEIRLEDFPEYDKYGDLKMLFLQEDLERNFYNASGRKLSAPAQRMNDFVNGKISFDLPCTSYAPGIHSAPLHFLLPPHISSRLRKGFKSFDRKCRGFLTNDAVLIGLESRTSSPVRIPRNPDTLSHIEISGLYPAGEGAGYAGGIVSAAIDGERCVEAFYNSIKS